MSVPILITASQTESLNIRASEAWIGWEFASLHDVRMGRFRGRRQPRIALTPLAAMLADQFTLEVTQAMMKLSNDDD